MFALPHDADSDWDGGDSSACPGSLHGGTFEKLTPGELGLALAEGYQPPGLLVMGWVFTSSLFDGVWLS